MEKTYIITESELQALLEKQKVLCYTHGWVDSKITRHNGETILNLFYDKDSFVKAPTPDLSHLKEAVQELEELRAWKESAMKVMPDFQEIGKLLNIPLGTSVSEQIIPKIKELKEAEQK